MDISTIAQAVTAVVVAVFGLVKAIQGLISIFKKK